LPDKYLSAEKRKHFDNTLKENTAISYSMYNGHAIAPKSWEE
jgi:hypothetical protein